MSIETFGTKSDVLHAGRERVENVQALRGIASIMVVFYHIGLVEHRIFGSHSLIAPVTASWKSGVDLFFVISGFVMVTISTGRFHGQSGARKFFFRRAARIYPVYWFYLLVSIAFLLYQPDFLINTPSDWHRRLLRSFLLFPDNDLPVLAQGWTLIHELYFYLVFALALKWPENRRMAILALWGGLIIMCRCVPSIVSMRSPVMSVATNSLTFEFLAGCAIAWIANHGFHRFSVPALICAVLGFLIASVFDRFGTHVLLYIGPTSLLVYGAVSIETGHRYYFPRWLRYVGDFSYSLYLTHILSASVVRSLWLCFHVPRGVASDLAFTAASGAFCLAVGAISYRWIEKPMLSPAYQVASRLASLGFVKSTGSK